MKRARRPFVALLLTALVVAPAGAASAHDQLTGSDPEDGATVEAPDELVLTFSGEIGQLGAQVAVTGPDGGSVIDGEPDVDGTELEQDLVDDLAAGDYEVVWRVTSQDGHPITGELSFTVEAVADDSGDDATDDSTDDATTGATDDGATSPTDGATDGATDDASDGATGDDATDGASAPTREPATGETTEEATDDADVTADASSEEAQGLGGLPVWAWVLLALAAAGLLGLLARTWARGRE